MSAPTQSLGRRSHMRRWGGYEDMLDDKRPYQVKPRRGENTGWVILEAGGLLSYEGAIEAETMKVVRVGGGKVRKQNMAGFKTGRWSGSEQLFWTGARPRARLVLELEVAEANTYAVAAAFTTARDYAIVNLLLDDEALRRPVDLYDYPDVGTTGELDCGTRKLGAGKHRLTVEITGANDSAVQAYRVGFDYLRLVRAQ